MGAGKSQACNRHLPFAYFDRPHTPLGDWHSGGGLHSLHNSFYLSLQSLKTPAINKLNLVALTLTLVISLCNRLCSCVHQDAACLSLIKAVSRQNS